MTEETQATEPVAEQAPTQEISVVTRLKKQNKETMERLLACDKERNEALAQVTFLKRQQVELEGLLKTAGEMQESSIKNNQYLLAEVKKLRDLLSFYLTMGK